MSTDDFVVTPWHVEGEIDYDKLIKRFGTQKITNQLLERIKKIAGEDHFMLRRGIFFSHRDMNRILDDYEKGKKFFLYTGRGPSGHTHIGHLVPWVFAKWLQDKLGGNMYFHFTDDEKFLSHLDSVKFLELFLNLVSGILMLCLLRKTILQERCKIHSILMA